MFVLVYAVEEVHVLRIALAIAAETVQRHNEGQWPGIVMSTWHPEEGIPSSIPHCHVCMLVSIVCRSKPSFELLANTFCPKLIVCWYV